MVDPELLRKALFERIQSLAESGVTHLAPIDWHDLLAPSSANPPMAPVQPASPPRLEGLPTRPESLPSSEPRPQTLSSRPLGSAVPAQRLGNAFEAAQTDLSPYGPSTPAPQRSGALQVIQTEVAACQMCPELVRNRKQTVFGVGNPHARLCFLGEAPGQEEDLKGEPFVGAAGQLLDKIIVACKLQREEVFILNTIKCRPPMNRTPNDQEVEHCWHFAHRQLEIIQPEFICCLGSVAAKSLLKTGRSISQLRGSFHRYRGSQVVVTYHPAYLLRTPSAKRHVWEDMKMLMRAMGVEL